MNHRVGAPLDRLDGLRDSPDALTPQTRTLLFTAAGVAIRSGETGEAGAAGVAGSGELVTLPLGRLPEGSRRAAALLGELAGTRFAAVQLHDPADLAGLARGDVRIESVRSAVTFLPADQAGLVLYGAGLLAWHRRARHCGFCGAPTEPRHAGHQRVCSARGCGRVEFPRTDAAIITLLRRDERALLIRQPAWPAGRFSCIAGFVEPGESLEQALAREVMEEVGLTIASSAYVASQPWPFPHSLMVGFRSVAGAGDVLAGEEVAEWRWLTRDGLRDAVARNEITLSPPMSVARSLIDDWLGEPAAEVRSSSAAARPPRTR